MTDDPGRREGGTAPPVPDRYIIMAIPSLLLASGHVWQSVLGQEMEDFAEMIFLLLTGCCIFGLLEVAVGKKGRGKLLFYPAAAWWLFVCLCYEYQPQTLRRFAKLMESPDWSVTSPPRNAQGMATAVHRLTGLVFVLIPAGEFPIGLNQGGSTRTKTIC